MRIKPSRNKGKVVLELKAHDPELLVPPDPWSGLPFHLRRVLVPIDFSPCAYKALQYALPLAVKFGAAISVLYVVEVNYAVGDLGAIDITPLEKELWEQAQARLERLVGEQLRPRVEANAILRTGRAVSEIAAVAREIEADLIVIATHGYTGLKHVLLGSTAENVLRHAPCPVLVVREEEREFIES